MEDQVVTVMKPRESNAELIVKLAEIASTPPSGS